MKRYFNFFKALSAAVLLFAVSCERDNFTDDRDDKGLVVTREFDASCPDDDAPESKTYLFPDEQLNKYILRWKKNDIIRIVGEQTDVTTGFTKLSKDEKKGSFTAEVVSGEQLYAVYPVSSYAGLATDGCPTFTIPQSQSGLDEDLTMMIAKDNDGSFNFRNVCALLRFRIDVGMYPTAKKVRINTLSSSQRPAGKAKVIFAQDGSFTVEPYASGQASLTVDCSGEPYLNMVSVYAAIIPQTYNGLKFEILDSNNKTIRTITYNRVLYADPSTLIDFGILTEHLDEYEFMAESFSDCTAVGGGDSNYSTCGESLDGVNPNDKTDVNGWSFFNCFEADGCIRVSDNLTKGYAVTPALNIETGRATVSFDVAKGGIGVPMYVFVEGNGIINSQIVYAGNGYWTTNVIYISNADRNTRLRFESVSTWYGDSKDNSFYLDNVKVIDGSPSFTYLNFPEGFVYVAEAEDTKLVFPLYSSSNTTLQTDPREIEFTDTYHNHNTQQLVHTFAENPEKDIRKAFMAVTNEDQLYIPYTIIQLGKTALFAKSDKLSFPGDGGEKKLKLDWWNFADDAVIEAETGNDQFSANVNKADSCVIITAKANGTIEPVESTLTVTMSDGERSRSVEVALSQEHGVIDQTLAFDPVSLSITVGTEYTLPVLTGAKTPVSYSIESADAANPVATIDSETGELNLLGVDGTATVTATAEANEYYHSASATYTLTVTGNQKAQEIKFVDAADETVSVSSVLIYTGTGINNQPIYSDYKLPKLTGANTGVTYTIENADPDNAVASSISETGVLVLTGKTGTATIKAVAAETSEFSSAQTSYTVELKPMLEQTLTYSSKNGVKAKTVSATEALFETEYYNFSIHKLKGSTQNIDYSGSGIKVANHSSLTFIPALTYGIKYIEIKTANNYPITFDTSNNIEDYSTEHYTTEEYYIHRINVSNPLSTVYLFSTTSARISQIRILYYPTE